MSDSLVLNALFALIGILFLAIGFRRGLLREVFVSAGLLVGAMLSTFWSARAGESIARWFDISTDSATFLASMTCFGFGLIILGYGGAMAALAQDAIATHRLAGGLLGGVNGALLFSLILSEIDRSIADDAASQTIRDAILPSILSRHLDWILFISTAAMVLLISFSLFAGRKRVALSRSHDRPDSLSINPPAGRRSPRLRWGRDDDKVEPGRRKEGVSGTSLAFADTMATAPVEHTNWAMDVSRDVPAHGPEWLEIRPESTFGVVESKVLVRCSSCGERLNERDGFCPRCGRARA